jgi:UDP-N-acetylglucosamine transferase subunit ALG13
MSMNPRNPNVGGEKCEKFRPNERTVMKKGMTHFYVDMPASVEKAIRQALIMQFGRTQYFEMRNGKRLITPSDQELIADICHDYGWNGPFVYDGEEEDWLW